MAKKWAPMALAASALCAFALALPAVASAATIKEITQDDLNASNQYRIESGDKNVIYSLASESDTLTGSILVTGSANQITIDLNGKTLVASDNYPAISTNKRITVRNGAVVQPTNMAAIQLGDGAQTVTLEDVDATSTGYACVETNFGQLLAKSCSFKTTNADGTKAPVIRMAFGGSFSTNVEAVNSSFTIEGEGADTIFQMADEPTEGDSVPILDLGCSLSDFPLQQSDGSYVVRATLGDATGTVVFKAANDDYKVVSKDGSAYADCAYRVDAGSDMGLVYFEDQDQADALASKLGVSTEQRHQVVFDAGKYGSKVDTEYVWDGDTAAEPAEPTCSRDGYEFAGWYTPDGTKFDFDDTKITEDVYLSGKWKAINPVAQVAGSDRQFASIQDAVDDADEGDTVLLLKSTSECFGVGAGKDLTIDLQGFTITAPEDTEITDQVINVTGDAKLRLNNGKVIAFRGGDTSKYRTAPCLRTRDITTADITLSDLELQGGYAPIQVESGVLTLAGDNNRVAASVRGDFALLLGARASVTIEGGEFSSGGIDESDAWGGCISLNGDADLVIKGGTFDDRVITVGFNDDPSLTIYDGSFGRPDNAANIAGGKVFYKSGSASHYEVVSMDDARSEARFVVTDATVSPKTKVYTALKSDAESYFSRLGGDSTLHKMHKVQLVSRKHPVSTLYLESVVDALGTLPEGEKVSGYTFAGWFLGGDTVSSDTVLSDDLDYDVTIEAMWTKDDSAGDPTNDPDGDGSSSDSKGSKGSSSVVPQTGDATVGALGLALVGAAVAGVGALRRRA